jgi:hypothetical protein
LTTYQSLTQAPPSLSLHVCTCWLACGTGTCITVNASSRLPVPSVSLSPTADVAGALARSLLLAVSKAGILHIYHYNSCTLHEYHSYNASY